MIEHYNAGVESQRIVEDYQQAADELRRLYFENEKFRASLAEQPAQHKLLPQGEWPKHPSPYVNDQYRGYLRSDLDDCAMQVLAAHGIKENT